ncbi:hypothetical protein [Synechococcus sp. J7-Johnson]|uniref:hypothetical protein n=1 Tax=Synechococcus sp. J7-Johnson TaxID=2823737 RepID=UPI0020CC6080|nr:hypothetical protein [Synechococcus sp. J7-Johnson]
MANLTLSLDPALLHQARACALQEHTTVNALVRNFLRSYVDGRSRRLEALDALDALAERTSSRSTGTWTRESLHSRQES